MFFLMFAFALINVYFYSCYFTHQLEYLVVEYIIPFLNKRNTKRIIQVKVFNETINEPIKLNVLHCEELNQPLKTNNNYQETINNINEPNDENIIGICSVISPFFENNQKNYDDDSETDDFIETYTEVKKLLYNNTETDDFDETYTEVKKLETIPE